MELSDYLNVIRARKWLIIQSVLIVTVVTLVVSMLQAPSYEGEAKLLISSQDAGATILGSASGAAASNAEGGLDTQVQLVQLRPLAEKAVATLHLTTTPDALLQQVSVSAVGQTNVITLTASDGNATRAAAIANALADAYVQWSKDMKRQSIRAAADEVQTRLDAAKSEIQSLSKQIHDFGATSERTTELNIAIAAYSRLSQNLEELKVNEQLELGSGRVVSPAAVDPTPVSPKPVRNGMLALIAGLVIGLTLAFLLEYLDNSIKSTEDVNDIYGVPVVGHVPAEKLKKGEKRQLSVIADPRGASSEAFQILRNNLNFINFKHDIKTLLITSAAPGEGKSTVAANLAATLAQAGAKVVLVNADFRRPVTEEFFEVGNTVGLSDVLAGNADLSAALQPAVENLTVLNSGDMPPNPSELLGSEKMGTTLKFLGELYQWVIVDSPPLLVAADSSALVRWADAVLVIVRGGVSTREAAKSGSDMLAAVGARTIGVVLWGSKGEASGAYGMYGSYAHHSRGAAK